jgi:hypothetical protein
MQDERGDLRAVPVTTGIADDRFTEILSGLREGDKVIVALEREPAPAPTTAGRGPSFGPPRRR